MRPVENLSSERAGAFRHGDGTADTVALVSPAVPHTYSICNGPQRRQAISTCHRKETLKWIEGRGVLGRGLDRVEVAGKVTVKSGRCAGASLPDRCCRDPVPQRLIANGQHGEK